MNFSEDLKSLLTGLLTKHPMSRLGMKNGTKEILKHPWFKKIKIDDIVNKKIEPPIKPNIMSFNFDEDEFSNGEKEFR